MFKYTTALALNNSSTVDRDLRALAFLFPYGYVQAGRIVILIFPCSLTRLDSRGHASRENLRQAGEHA
jgi:hypothetical protein